VFWQVPSERYNYRMSETFPFSSVTANELTFDQRDELYARLHDRPQTTIRHSYGPQLVWKHADVREVLQAESSDISNTNSLDPLEGFKPILSNPRTYLPFARHLVPLPARATANASGTEHALVWRTMTDFLMRGRHEQIDSFDNHFQDTLRSLGHAAGQETLDVTQLSVQYAARITGDTVGLDCKDWAQVAIWSKNQSGLLGQRLRGQDQANAVRGLGELFSVSKQVVQERAQEPRRDLASHLLANGIDKRIAVAALANCLAAGVHTIAGTLQQATERLLHPSYRDWWEVLGNDTDSLRISQKALQLDPGLVGWKRKVVRATVLASGTELQKGEVVAMFGAANRDPDVFPDAAHNLVKRAPILTFGSGTHVCPGRNLATMSSWVFLRNLYDIAEHAQVVAREARQRPRDLLFSGADIVVTNL
jgi:cytochrome P450